MKVLLIDVNCKHSSTGKIVYDLYQSLREQGHQAAICYGRGDKVYEPNIYKFGLDWETIIHALLARITGVNGCFSFFSTKRLIRYIDAFKPDIIHIHEIHAYFVNIKPLLKYIQKKKIKVVWTFHCEYMYTGKCGHAHECEKWKTECNKCPAIKEYPKSLLFDRTKHMYHQKKDLLASLDITIVTPSKWLADRVKESYLKNKSIQIIHNGIDEKVFYPVETYGLREEFNIPLDNKIVLAVAPHIMSEAKGGRWILKLAENMKSDKVSFILVGTDSEESQKENVWFVKKTNNQSELAKYYSLADVFVICSKKETFSMTCAESLLCGTLVVGFESGAPETIFEEPFATFVPYGDLNSLQGAISSMFDRDITQKEIVTSAREKYSKEMMVQQYLNLYGIT